MAGFVVNANLPSATHYDLVSIGNGWRPVRPDLMKVNRKT